MLQSLQKQRIRRDEMKKIEAPTLEDAYAKAALELECTVGDLSYEVIQHPSNGLLGFMKKNAIIVAECTKENRIERVVERVIEHARVEISDNDGISSQENIVIDETREEVIIHSEVQPQESVPKPLKQKKHIVDEELTKKDDEVLDSFFDDKVTPEETTPKVKTTTKVNSASKVDSASVEKEYVERRPENNNLELAERIEAELAELLSKSCFAIDTVEVDVVDNTALIFIDGDDAALLIGKEGYRYNALSYMLFNWLFTKYNLYIKLEIAQFLTSQQEMIRSYIEPVIEHVKANGKGKTRPLDGILVQIALEQLREAFPDKYVAVKTARDGRRFVLINEFNSRKND